MIRFDQIRVTFDNFTAISDLNLEVAEGEFFTLLGPSGCGKTTALRTLAGLVTPSSGDIHIDGKKVTALPSDKRGIGMVFQNYALFPSMSVRENIAFGLKVRKTAADERAELVRDIARRVDLSDDQLEKNVSELSGGQQQRVAIARALVLKPKILLLDEPLSNLDAKLRQQLRVELKELQVQEGITTVYVTHDQDEALTMSDRVAVFNKGVIEQVGTPEEIYERSATEFVCNFIGDSSKLGPELVSRLASASGRQLDPRQLSYLRVEKPFIDVGADSGDTSVSGQQVRTASVEGQIVGRSYHGQHSRYTVRSYDSDVKVLVKETGAAALDVGHTVQLHLDPAYVLQYQATS
ncbi:ABC transporter ATP-binding protein (plasmid) [Arthrobacter agilis]|uniref:ABC transporter ATP-binding protein n=1 Tax=Arthrobacter agilis TaxID=37921 RepID=UPI0023672A2D|nr:ABC transporter ATP-binding protein [Arthrobacter agilis]WDF35302.1 ABC transporter ATP-binding protein [Arthrobacter agilis]